MSVILPLRLELGRVIRTAIEKDGVTRADVEAAFGMAMTRLDQQNTFNPERKQ